MIISLILLSLPLSCENWGTETPKKINLESNRIELKNNNSISANSSVKVAISAMLSPNKTFTLYVDLVNYISQKIGMPVTFVQRKSYQEVNELLENGYLDLAFICSGAYTDLKKSLDIIAVPIVNGKPYYYSYIIVPASGQSGDIASLKGKKAAFVDPLSNTGRLYLLYLLKSMGISSKEFFGDIIYTHSHDRSIELVAQGVVDVAAVDSLVWDYYIKLHPETVKKVRIINKSQPFGIPPFVSPLTTPEDLRNAIRQTLLTMDKDEEGKKILFAIGIERFERAEDGLYESIRMMRRAINVLE